MPKTNLIKNPITPNDPDTDYWNGFIAADGNIYNNQIKIELQEQDKDHVQKFCNYFQGIKLRSRYKKQFNKTLYLAAINNIDINNYYKSIGILSNKSLNLDYKGNFNWPFLRGIFDGDGSINISKSGYVRVMFYSSSIKFISQISEFLIKEGFNVTIKSYDKRTKNSFYSIWICKKSEVLKLFSLMYKDGQYYMERKKQKFLNIK